MVPNLTGLVLEGKYRLTTPLGEGGMGFVYAAEHATLHRPLAVKFLRPELASDPNALARLRQEAIAASSIGSPHIVEVLDLGTAQGGAPFIVMEFLRGRPLAALMAESPVLPVPRIANILCQTLLALQGAHARGIVHRDLKPENIFLVGAGGGDFVKLLDFGVSKVRGDLNTSNLTQTGAVLGTPRFMAPEQAAGRRDVDHRVDLWAAGVILYRAVTGRYPYDAENYNALLAQILMANPPPPRQVRPDLDPNLERIILFALARDPAARFASAEQFRLALLAYVPSPSLSAQAVATGPQPPYVPLPTVPAPAVVQSPGAPSAAAPVPSVSAAWSTAGSVAAVARPATQAQAPKRSRTALWLVLGLVLAAGVGSGAAWLFVSRPWEGDGVPAAKAPPAKMAQVEADVVAPVPNQPTTTTTTTTLVPRPVEGTTTTTMRAPSGVETATTTTAAGTDAAATAPLVEAGADAVAASSEGEPDAGSMNGETNAAIQAAMAMATAYMDGGTAADISGAEAAERDRWVAATAEVACATNALTMQLYGGENPTADPMALPTLIEKLQAQVIQKHGFTLESYGEATARWAEDPAAMTAFMGAAMRCQMQAGMAGMEE
jgi:serine/threonine-protein kinase